MPAMTTEKPKTEAVGLPKCIKIIVNESDNIPPTGLPVSLNGKAYIIRPGVEVCVPEGVIEILDHAVESVPTVDPLSRRLGVWRERPRFPYRIVRD